MQYILHYSHYVMIKEISWRTHIYFIKVEKLASLVMMGALGTPWYDSTVMYGVFRGALNWAPLMLRNASLSEDQLRKLYWHCLLMIHFKQVHDINLTALNTLLWVLLLIILTALITLLWVILLIILIAFYTLFWILLLINMEINVVVVLIIYWKKILSDI